MRFAYPRLRETHIYKKQLLGEREQNLSVSLVQLKKEHMRQASELERRKAESKLSGSSSKKQAQ